jgi:hypothetical protein
VYPLRKVVCYQRHQAEGQQVLVFYIAHHFTSATGGT